MQIIKFPIEMYNNQIVKKEQNLKLVIWFDLFAR